MALCRPESLPDFLRTGAGEKPRPRVLCSPPQSIIHGRSIQRFALPRVLVCPNYGRSSSIIWMRKQSGGQAQGGSQKVEPDSHFGGKATRSARPRQEGQEGGGWRRPTGPLSLQQLWSPCHARGVVFEYVTHTARWLRGSLTLLCTRSDPVPWYSVSQSSRPMVH